MNQNFVRLGTMGAFLTILAGCATQPASPPTGPVRTPPTAPTPAAEASAVRSVSAPSDLLTRAAAQPPAPFPGEGWQPLLAGVTPWTVTRFAGAGEVERHNGILLLTMGSPFTGIHWTNPPARLDYELALDAMRVSGSDFFCGLTFPVGEACCSLIVGGWGGGLVGISSLDGQDASENETTQFHRFENGRWYRIRVRVAPQRITAWIDDTKVVDVDITGRRIAVRPGEIELSQPLGVASWMTTAALREIRWRPLPRSDSN